MWTVNPEIVVSAADKAAAAKMGVQQSLKTAIIAHLDAVAATRLYGSIEAAISYRGDPNPIYASEAEALFEWRSAVWTYASVQLAKIDSGEREVPTMDTFVAELPVMVWPSQAKIV